MSRRLQEATEETLLTGGRAGRRAVEDAGFSEELRDRLLAKLADAEFREEHRQTISAAGLDPQTMSKMPAAAADGTRLMASRAPWTGEEAPEDAVLRMLNDAKKPLSPSLRAKPNIPKPVPVDMRLRRQPTISAGRRVANAKERASAYAGMGIGRSEDKGLSDKEKEAMKKEFRDRFTPGARAMPNTITGLASLANERIEDAIARGQFKNIARGKGVERDTRADNPFVDTTEYIMNKMIKRQDIVPPWIEKQQELVKAANVFRTRLRSDWKRHAARTIASRGGSLDSQMEVAREYARAEEVYNPRRRNIDQISVPSNTTDDPVMAEIRKQALPSMPSASTAPAGPRNDVGIVLTRPFRDREWERAERSYMELAVSNLNTITRSYNLICPELAKKPYFSLDRELKSCFADVAPQLAETIRARATKPTKSLLNAAGSHGRAALMDRFGRESKTVKIYDSKTPNYGLKEMWKDFWSRPG
jgi:hypothetical protein